MTAQWPIVFHLNRVEGGLRDLLTGAGTDQRRCRRHYQAENALNAFSALYAKGNADIPSGHDFDFAYIREELLTPEGVDIPSHYYHPGFCWGHAAAQHRHNLGMNLQPGKLNCDDSVKIRRQVAGCCSETGSPNQTARVDSHRSSKSGG